MFIDKESLVNLLKLSLIAVILMGAAMSVWALAEYILFAVFIILGLSVIAFAAAAPILFIQFLFKRAVLEVIKESKK